MKNIFLISVVFFFISTLSLNAQSQGNETPSTASATDILPVYPGPETFPEYLHSKIKNSRFTISQRVVITFVVEKDGTLSNISFSEGTEKSMKKKALKAFKKAKRWTPGSQNGKLVRVLYSLPLTVKVSD